MCFACGRVRFRKKESTQEPEFQSRSLFVSDIRLTDQSQTLRLYPTSGYMHTDIFRQAQW